MPALCTNLPTPTKGLGVFTLQPISPGTVLLQDKPILHLSRGPNDVTATQVSTALSVISPQEQTTFLSLHENNLPYSTRELRIYKSNCFGDAATAWLSLVFSRVNHSCAPNAEIAELDSPDGVVKVIALKALEKGEEVTISYLAPEVDGVGRERMRLLRETYGFDCCCEACGLRGREGWLSDARRGLIAVLTKRQSGLETQELKKVEGVNGIDAQGKETQPLGTTTRPLAKPLTPQEKVTTNYLLARLLEAENLINYRLSQAYVHAAVGLMGQMQELKPLVIIPAAKNVTLWLERAQEVMELVRKEGSRDVVELRKACGVLGGCAYMRVAREVMGKEERGEERNGKMRRECGKGKKPKGRKEKGQDVFATVFGQSHRRLTQKECIDEVRKMTREKSGV